MPPALSRWLTRKVAKTPLTSLLTLLISEVAFWAMDAPRRTTRVIQEPKLPVDTQVLVSESPSKPSSTVLTSQFRAIPAPKPRDKTLCTASFDDTEVAFASRPAMASAGANNRAAPVVTTEDTPRGPERQS